MYPTREPERLEPRGGVGEDHTVLVVVHPLHHLAEGGIIERHHQAHRAQVVGDDAVGPPGGAGVTGSHGRRRVLAGVHEIGHVGTGGVHEYAHDVTLAVQLGHRVELVEVDKTLLLGCVAVPVPVLQPPVDIGSGR